MKEQIQKAMALRKEKKPEEALALLISLLTNHPKDPDIQYQIAWTYDSMGNESVD